jgi:TMPIT-like protein
MDSDIEAKIGAISASLSVFEAEVKPQQEALAKYKALATEEDKLRTTATNGLKAKRKQLASFQRQLEELSAIRAQQQHMSALPELDAAIARLQDRVDALQGEIRELVSIEPGWGDSNFVRLFLGRVNVKVASPKDRELLRDEYNRFKDKTNVGFIIAPLIWLMNQQYLSKSFSYTDWIYTLTHLWLLYYYTSLGLRENILRAVS